MAHETQLNLRPAEECIWYVLATIAGEPGQSGDLSTMAENQRYWNGLMRERRFWFGFVESAAGGRIELPILSDEDRQAIRSALDSRGFRDAPIPGRSEPIDFSHVRLPNGFSTIGFVFGGITAFDGAQFKDSTHIFHSTVFEGAVTFGETEFYGGFVLSNAKFMSGVSFKGAQFHQSAAFTGCVFPANVGFDGARFLKQARFDKCRFELGASFVSTTFESEADFSSADFQGPALFQRAEFKAHVPTFFGATLHEYTEWHGAKWPAVPEGTDQALNHIHGYQRLAKMMNELEMFDDQLRFVRLEMRARRRVEKWFPAGLMNHAYELICDYGFGLGRILAIWAGHVAVGAALLFVPKLIETLKNGGGAGWQPAKESIIDLLLALVLSFINAHGPLGLYRTYFQDGLKDWPWLIWVGPVQTVLGVIILFFLLLTIRNRFRMR